MTKVAIIGAGPTGLAIAHQLTKSQIAVDVYDSAGAVGGFAKSIELWGRTVEIGPHFLNVGHLPAVKNMVLDCLNDNYRTYKRKTFILKNGRLFVYPPAGVDLIRKLNPLQLGAAALSLARQKFSYRKEDGTAKTYVTRRLGGYLSKAFFEPFSLKLWGVGADRVADTFAKSLIGFKDVSLFKRTANQLFKATVAKETYMYPNGGLSTLWNAMKLKVEAQGGRFLLLSRLTGLSGHQTDPQVLTHLSLADGTVAAYDYFISTIPLAVLNAYLKKETTPAVNFRSAVLLYLKVQYDSARDGQCFYIYSEDINITRLTNFNKFDANADDSFAIILLECWCGKSDTVWHTGTTGLLELARTELDKTGIFKKLTILDMVIKKIESAFQIPGLDDLENRGQLWKQLARYRNLRVTGRYASVNFNYGMENAMDDGLKLARELSLNLKQNEHLND